MSDRHSIRWRSAVVLTSAAVFIACLTQTGFAIPRVTYSGLFLLTTGWVAGLWIIPPGWVVWPLVGLFLNPLVFVSIIAAWPCFRNKWEGASAIAVMFAIGPTLICPGEAAWVANPIIVVTWLLYLRDGRPSALIFAVVALGLTLSFLRAETAPYPELVDLSPVISYGTGYWLWVASAAIMVVGVSADMFGHLVRKVLGTWSQEDADT
jgi:hypothetical protein